MAGKIRVGIVGCGFVGGALLKWLTGNNRSGCDCVVSDPPKGMNGDLSTADIVFIQIHVHTETDGSQDLSTMVGIISGLPNVPVFVRTTVLPGTSEYLSKETGHDVRYMPEFLTERTSVSDFSSQTMTFTGHVDLLRRVFPGRRYVEMSPLDAEIAKYAHNVFGAMKVTYFNAVREYCLSMGANWDNVHNGCLLSGYINRDHTEVPGPDGKFGYGGKCFPKDVDALCARVKGTPLGAMIAPLSKLNSHFRTAESCTASSIGHKERYSIAAHITFMDSPSRYGVLMETIRSLMTIPGIDIFVHTNSSYGFSFLPDSVNVVVHDLSGENPFMLSTKSRKMISDNADKYDYTVYIEDDVGFSIDNLRYFIKYHKTANRNGYYLGFLLTERRFGAGDMYLCVQTGQTKNKGFTDIDLDGTRFFTVNDHEYDPFWIMDKESLLRFMSDMPDTFWLRSGLFYGSPHMVREDASIGPSKTMYKRMAYVDDAGLLVRHLSDKYTNIPGHPFGKNRVSDYLKNCF